MMTLKDEEILDEEVHIYPYVYDRKIKIFHERDVVGNAQEKVTEHLKFVENYKHNSF